MSFDATRWAWTQRGLSTSQRCTLLSLADRAGEDHTCYPSLKRIAFDTEQDIKTVRKAIKGLCEKGLILRQDRRGESCIYQLVGIEDWKQNKETPPPKVSTPTTIGRPSEISNSQEQNGSSGHAMPAPASTHHARRRAFEECWQIYPIKQCHEGAWREWRHLSRIGILPDAQEVYQALVRHIETDSRWKRGKIPLLKNWLKDKRWADQPHDENATQLTYQTLPLWQSVNPQMLNKQQCAPPAWEDDPPVVSKHIAGDVCAALRGDVEAKARMAARVHTLMAKNQ